MALYVALHVVFHMAAQVSAVVTIIVSEIIKTWQSLVQKFKTCLINEKKAGTGSRAVQHDFVYYEHMSFLKAALAHRKQLSTGIMQPANVQAPCTSASSFVTERKYNLTSTTPDPRSRAVPAFDKESSCSFFLMLIVVAL
ncbi:hypothetical protein TSAR_007337 [Trichomalopsis sarcophagae]|uniref:Uncharacterized protein n=1 Tax=Trichomalopsis sarcophagae TaxID=543379 RepID=A0A232EMX2_9HYME|nr:hypothetical protein TSAR_007337 [Trichomalopsis sarcophagae]